MRDGRRSRPPVGVLADDASLYDALDGAGRDAAAHGVLDLCGGHGHASSSCHHRAVPASLISRAPNGVATLVGYALDGYGVHVVEDAAANLPANAMLGAGRGATGVVSLERPQGTEYHCVATRSSVPAPSAATTARRPKAAAKRSTRRP